MAYDYGYQYPSGMEDPYAASHYQSGYYGYSHTDGTTGHSTGTLTRSGYDGNEQQGSCTFCGVILVCSAFLVIVAFVFVLLQSSVMPGDSGVDSATDPIGSSGSGGGGVIFGRGDPRSGSGNAGKDKDGKVAKGDDDSGETENGMPEPLQPPKPLPPVQPPPTHPPPVPEEPPTAPPAPEEPPTEEPPEPEEPPTEPPVTKPPKGEEPVKEIICTVGRSAVIPTMYPNDGLCDYLYYTHLIVAYGRVRASEIKTSWTLFQDTAKTLSKTGAGVSFDARYVTATQLRPDEIKEQVKKLANIKHYGVLNVYAQDQTLEVLLREIVAVAVEMKKFQAGYESGKVVVALGMPDYSAGTSWALYVQMVKDTVEKSAADTVIVISSTGMIETEQDCFAVPPAVIKSQYNIFPSLDRAGPLVSISTPYEKRTAIVGISLEMSVLTYILEEDAQEPDQIPYKKCIRAGADAAHIMCPADAREVSKVAASTFGGFVLPGNRRFVFLAEHEETIKEKVEFMKSIRQRDRTAWLLYNVHLTDLEKGCLTSHHRRIDYLKSLIRES